MKFKYLYFIEHVIANPFFWLKIIYLFAFFCSGIPSKANMKLEETPWFTPVAGGVFLHQTKNF